MKTSWVYILRCSDGSYYTGCTTELSQRLAQHQDGTFGVYTSSRRPVALMFSQEFSDINDSIRAERQIKGWSRMKKEALIAGTFDLLHELGECKNETHCSRHGERSRTMTGLRSHPSTSLRVTTPLERLNIIDLLTRCCGSSRWVEEMAARWPFASDEIMFQTAEQIWWSLSESDWREAFAHHPRIGDIQNLRMKFASTAHWASSEQAGATNASEEILRLLADGNAQYEKQFGYIFIVCATGRTAEEMLGILKSRLQNSSKDEIMIAAGEQANITRLRLEKLIGNTQPSPQISKPGSNNSTN